MHDSRDFIHCESINFWLQQLRKQFKDSIGGMDDTTNFVNISCENKNSVIIPLLPMYSGLFANIVHVHVSSNHWICVSNYEAAANSLNVYDSSSTFNEKIFKTIH